MPPTVSASSMATPVEVDADIDFDFDFQGRADDAPTRGKLSRSCAEAIQALATLQWHITPNFETEDDPGIDPGRIPIDWQAGVAELLDAQGNVRTRLRVPPAESPTSPEAIDEVAQAFVRLVQGAGRPLGKYWVRDRETTRWPTPSTVTLDGDVLRIDRFVIGRRRAEPLDDAFWARRSDLGELQFLMQQRSPRSARWVAEHGADRYPRPTFEGQASTSTRRAGRFDETWVFHVAGDADVATVLANSRAESTRLFCIDRQPPVLSDQMALREVHRDEGKSPATSVEGAGAGIGTGTGTSPGIAPARERRVRVMVVGDSARHEGSSTARVGLYDPQTLARTLKAAVGRIAAMDGVAAILPAHVSIISSHHESQAFRSHPDVWEPSFGTAFLKTAIDLFGAPAMTASMRKDGFRVASYGPRKLRHEDGEHSIEFTYNVVRTHIPELDGRKFIRSAAGDYLNKAPGKTVVLWRADDGSIRSADKYADLGQTHVKDTWLPLPRQTGQSSAEPPVPQPAQQPGPLISWLRQRPTSAVPSLAGTEPGPETPPGKSRPTPVQSPEPLILGEVEIQRSLLQRMGWRNDGRPLDDAGAFRWLRFAPDSLVALMDNGTVPERITVLRLLKQMLRAGAPASRIFQADDRSASWAQMPAAMNLLLALEKALDDDLMLPLALWDALWKGSPPPLPLSVPEKGIALSPLRPR